MIYTLIVPPTREQGSYTGRVNDCYTSKSVVALQQYNSARAHDGLPPVKRMPKGTEYRPIYFWEVQQYTGREYGWEVVSQSTNRREALADVRSYRENQPEYPARLHRRPSVLSDFQSL